MNGIETIAACKDALINTRLERSAIKTSLSLDHANARDSEQRFVDFREVHYIVQEKDPATSTSVAVFAESLRHAQFSQSVTDERGSDVVLARPKHVLLGLREFALDAFALARTKSYLDDDSTPNEDAIRSALDTDLFTVGRVERSSRLTNLILPLRIVTQALGGKDDEAAIQDFRYFSRLSSILEGLVHSTPPLVILDPPAASHRPKHARRYLTYRTANPLPAQKTGDWLRRSLNLFGRTIRHSIRWPWHSLTIDVPMSGGGEEILVKVEAPEEMHLTCIRSHPVRVLVNAKPKNTHEFPRGFDITRTNRPAWGARRGRRWAKRVNTWRLHHVGQWGTVLNTVLRRRECVAILIPSMEREPLDFSVRASSARISVPGQIAKDWSQQGAITNVEGQIEALKSRVSPRLGRVLDEFMGTELHGLTRSSSFYVRLREPILVWSYSALFVIGSITAALVAAFERLPFTFTTNQAILGGLGLIAALAAMWSRSSATMRYLLGVRFVFTTSIVILIGLAKLIGHYL